MDFTDSDVPDGQTFHLRKPAVLRVIVQDHIIDKLELPYGVPETVDELQSIVQQKYRLEAGKFTLHYMDVDFGREFFTLASTKDLKDKDTIKVVHIIDLSSIQFVVTDLDRSDTVAASSSTLAASTASSESDDTIILSSPEHGNLRSKSWPSKFPIPRFRNDTELVLATGNETFNKDGSPLSSTAILPDILERLAESIFEYVAYPTSAQFAAVAEALIQKHPCLKEPGSYNGCYGWQQRLKFKMGNYRSKLSGLGCPELEVNSLQKKRANEKTPAKNMKKARKGEANYLPPHPLGETKENLEQQRLDLLSEVKKKNNSHIICEKMERTFSTRRQEIVTLAPSVSDLKERWPALFLPEQIKEEYKRITTANLESTFIANLDHCIPRLMPLVMSRGGAAKYKIQNIMELLKVLDMINTVETRREVAIRCLVVYLGENEDSLFEYVDPESQTGDLDSRVMKILITKGTTASDPASTTVIIEGTEVLQGLDVPRACALLMGLIYALNLSYPQELKYTFEVFQKMFLRLDSQKCSPKVTSLRQKLQGNPFEPHS
ncbi:sterile alpha motif domain-containing protein 3 isoform X1 [Fundulus heteroclitus]|uniref:sterile alpha motif domain-containing protein 3 isoform X1 n=1 Tax=Fundulus heteroclitus TaxID=8078 RepID=UPI00165A7FAD|nr:sterile alpha motif domain-containing protein 3 isoform X1 [Fundulus heteroclitus]